MMRAGNHRLRRLAFTLLLVVTSISCSGCVLGILAAGAGAGAYVYATGDVERTYPYPIDVVWDASMASLAQLELRIVSASKDQLSGRVDAYTATGDRILLVLDGQGEVTSISVRVNTFGNKSMSAAILHQVDSRLSGQYAVPPSFGQPTPAYGVPAASARSATVGRRRSESTGG